MLIVGAYVLNRFCRRPSPPGRHFINSTISGLSSTVSIVPPAAPLDAFIPKVRSPSGGVASFPLARGFEGACEGQE